MKYCGVSANIKKQQPGFTLVELLVVISIISLLSSLGMVALNSARAKARDAMRLGQMAQLRTALAFYFDEHTNYPVCNAAGLDFSSPPNFGISATDGCQCYLDVLEAELKLGPKPIMPDPPRDPLNAGNTVATNPTYNFRYATDASGEQYALMYALEDGGEKYIRGW